MRATDGKGLRRVTRNPFGMCATPIRTSPLTES